MQPEQSGDHNLRIGKPDVKPTAPSHSFGVGEGNAKGNCRKMQGHLPDGRSNAERSTGVAPDTKNAILPEMPNISPA
jgi:hypothetical protein